MNDSDSSQVKQIEFPAEYRRSFADFFDRRYYSVLLGSIACHVLLVSYFLINPLPSDQNMDRIARIQAQLAKTLKDREERSKERLAKFEFAANTKRPDPETADLKPKKEPAPKKPAPAKDSGSSKTATAKKATPNKDTQVAARSRRRGSENKRSTNQIASSVGSKGLLGLLTSTSSISQGDEVSDILGSTQSNKDLDETLSNLSGITSGAGSSDEGVGTVKGGRTTGGTGIDDLVSGLGKAESSSVSRTGDFVVVSEAPLVENGSNGMPGRSQEGVQAVVLKHNNSIQYCYERELKRNPALKGKIVVRFTITPQGTIRSASIVSSNLNNRKVEQCVLARIRRWTDFGAIDPKYGDTTIKQIYAFGY